MNQSYKATLSPYALPQFLPTWRGKGGVIWEDLEVCSLKTMMFEKYPSISPYTYCANNPMKYVDPTGETLEEGDGDPPPGSNPTKIIKNTKEAVHNYYYGNGNPVDLDQKFALDILNTPEFKEHDKNIVSGNTTRLEGNFPVNLENVDDAYFIGDTRVDYKITFSEDKKTCFVTYTLFVNDGFWDPDYIKESGGDFIDYLNKNFLSNRPLFRDEHSIPDGIEPNLETPYGKPYKFNLQYITAEFPNPGYEE